MPQEELVEKILRLKVKRNAVILAHNYQVGEVQDLADFTGDSLGLSQQAAKTDADVIVFCGVLFMAETAAILSPEKTVLLPELRAGCPMADMITAEQLVEKKKQHPGSQVVCYVNSTAAVKAESDVCCTSSNAVKIVDKVSDNPPIIFVPDKYLGMYTASKTAPSGPENQSCASAPPASSNSRIRPQFRDISFMISPAWRAAFEPPHSY